ncbi:(Fe-S)-binding protein [Geobacter sulfurreducens]|jgi:glycolate oxidase iron-sulfur subunit|uniref:Glycolate oxidase iron-sulfur subunit n=1 Tax=Geobacter sulfurreducens (strain ATCC 51573 / DSM 12127 / PCA) TaxID=243231 RepID=Q74CP9_GEOSL|nr:(Fe-S)-binding protein [Geobacter sulfurreducens]BET58018.1 (Fe-S)-binding protein [Geobacter sp. 60473]AAR34998.1 D-lactate/glycolate dehydrogenase, iron-sulfur cluster-binding protein, putative [Geobacter sulfurreducens PCA]ADI84459.1 D-lactate dehydrogenase, CCG domain pair-containing subunit, putative [Geobacter sulfurreducens KN400]AJY71495.1 lactate dehydrogenase [Geobacter sulfurreducens]QVW36788.1 (Fe-S)-binding protein [Geobacter sulfurreducens]
MEYVKLINCMRCGMCLPQCPTYKETFLETASPRGRVALMRKIEEGDLEVSERLLEYLSLCLDCQACASACPCGVNAGEMVAGYRCERRDGKELSTMENLILRRLLPHPDRLEAATAPMRLYQRTGLQKVVRKLGILKMFPPTLERMEGLLPELPVKPLRQTIDEVTPAVGPERGTIGFFLGCVMSLVFSEASYATVKLLSSLGYRVVTPKAQKCCGAPNMLSGDREGLLDAARFNVDLFAGHRLDFIVTDCGGCGAELKKYGHHLEDDSRAATFSAQVRDITQVLALHADELKAKLNPLSLKVTYHDPCHIAHCQGIRQEPRTLLRIVPELDFRELPEADACCGSGGTYNIEKPEMSDRVLRRKVENIKATGADVLVTANPGCLLQLRKALAQETPPIRVLHVTEVLAASLLPPLL